MDLEVYQKILPTKEQWDSLVQMIRDCGSRMGIIESTSWYNELTKENKKSEISPCLPIQIIQTDLWQLII